jgi:spore germination protein Q
MSRGLLNLKRAVNKIGGYLMYWYDPYDAYLTSQPHQPGIAQQQSRKYSEDLLASNIGRTITVYLTYEKNTVRNNRVVIGVLRQVGRDFILVTDQQTGKDNLLLNINVDYIEFSKKANLAGENL